MIRKYAIFGAICFSFLFAYSASASSAGEIAYSDDGKPLPVSDPAMGPQTAPIPPNALNLPKKIVVDLSTQSLSYYYGDQYKVGEFKISSGLPRTPTPVGTFQIQSKIPIKAYAGRNYYLPNTKWNLKITSAGHYIHGAYWHNNFGRPMSHGCVNVSYADMSSLYSFADVGTSVIIRR
ncbi:MAG: hypothetical protein A3C88_00840 [Candidatus Yanofskybacteria bacterium RIFCSPHIGHO2_02_FULL_50_12]|uniref:L,D-TPase catalytic domain-containing protein n=1 Tax=Candidatus Yanofskybacteria bacterium RIFCSPHIGHO2_02_FULL_50_12 TaxID=1802685 RepID=A0A1F8FT34_9BACT|nr:MAG: hypothetical protein A3C88_00840 [Candidatus Yanofskybacteria bacterium RIFCSPHIGHO2_02_FULL_50_12]